MMMAERQRRALRPYVAAISGVKNSGKTTFLEHLIPCLRGRGWKVAVIKHDGHEFDPDVPGTDSYRLKAAGAGGVAVYSGGRWMMVREEEVDVEALVTRFSDFDIVLLEGQKHSQYPKIELVRGAVSMESVCDPETLLALATDTDCFVPGVEQIGLDDYERAAELLCAAAGWKNRKKEIKNNRIFPADRGHNKFCTKEVQIRNR